MKKYLVFGISSQFGGVESFLINYVGGMMDSDNQFEFVLFERVPSFFEESVLKKCKYYIVPTRTKRPIEYYRKLTKIIKNGNYDILWYNACTLSDITLVQIANKYGVPCRIIHSHSSANMGSNLVGILHQIHKRNIEKYITEAFACSKEAGEFMFPKKVDNITVINNAIQAQKYRYSEETRKKIRDELQVENEILIGHVGRFHQTKNHVLIIKVFSEILKLNSSAKLVLVGEGNTKEDIIQLAKEEKVFDNIYFLGKRMDVNELLQGMDVFLFPSLFEGLAISLVEAQAADLPCVISDTISKSTVLTDKIVALSLDDAPDKWAKAVLDSARKWKREDRIALIEDKGFDIEENARKLKNYLSEKY